MASCPRCQHSNADGASFCSRCGARIEVAIRRAAPIAAPGPATAAYWSDARRAPFLHANAWWSMGTAGEVLRWNADAERWDNVPLPAIPFFMRRPAYRSPRGLAIALYVLFTCFALAAAFGVVGSVYALTVANKVENGEYDDFSDVEDAVYGANDFATVPGGVAFLAMVPIAVIFIIWTRRATANVNSLGDQVPRFGTGWAVGGWFVPILSWWRPLQVMNQAWRVSDPRTALTGIGWGKMPGSTLLVFWWLAFVLFGAPWANTIPDPDTQTLEEWRIALITCAIFNVLSAAAAVLAIAAVIRLTSRQDARDRQLDLPQGLPGVPLPASAQYPAPPEMADAVIGW